jgi:hypothetical protein
MIPERRRQNAAVPASWEDRLNKAAQRLVGQNHARMLRQNNAMVKHVTQSLP